MTRILVIAGGSVLLAFLMLAIANGFGVHWTISP